MTPAPINCRKLPRNYVRGRISILIKPIMSVEEYDGPNVFRPKLCRKRYTPAIINISLAQLSGIVLCNDLICKGAKDYAFKISITAALRDRGDEARSVIMAELQQMLDKKVWHGVRTNGLTSNERKAVIRSSMFLKDKFTASGVFDKIKARLVAGGDQQDKELYGNLSSRAASIAASIAAREGRSIMVLDIGGAFLNADITGTGIRVHMRLSKVLTSMLVLLCPGHS